MSNGRSAADNAWSMDTPDPLAENPLFDIDEARIDKWLDTTPPVRRWLLDKCLPLGKVGMIVAPGGTGKSQFAMQLMLSVAAGEPLAGYWDICETGSVLALFAEEDPEELHRRFKSVFYSLDLEEDKLKFIRDRVFIKSLTGETNFMTCKSASGEAVQTDYLQRLLAVTKNIPNLKLIIIDPISRFRGGNEIDNDDATRFVVVLEELVKATGATVIGLHHTNKSSSSSDTASQNAARGASALVDGVRWVMNLQTMSEKEAKTHSIASNKKSYYLKVAVTKNNYAAPQNEDIWLSRGDTGLLNKIALSGSDEEFQNKKKQKIIKVIRSDAANDQEHTQRAFCDKYGGVKNEFGVGEKSLRALIKNLLEERRLILQPPKIPEKNKTEVLTIPLSVAKETEKYRKESNGE